MKILFTGLPYFGQKLVDDLSKFDKTNKYVFCNTYYSKRDKIKFLFHLLNSNLVVSFNGASSNSNALNWALRFKKKLIMFWHGSDVLTLKSNIQNGTFVKKYIDNSISFTDAVWLKDELKELNIEASILPFKYVEFEVCLNDFIDNQVVTYIAQGNEYFYGIETVYKCAYELPEVKFHVVGTDGKNQKKLDNIIYHGWVQKKEFEELISQHAIFLRATAHDGYSLSVLEAIANGNHVIWNYPHPMVNTATNEELVKSLLTFMVLNNSGILKRNETGINWAKLNLNKQKVLQNFIEVITQNGK